MRCSPPRPKASLAARTDSSRPQGGSPARGAWDDAQVLGGLRTGAARFVRTVLLSHPDATLSARGVFEVAHALGREHDWSTRDLFMRTFRSSVENAGSSRATEAFLAGESGTSLEDLAVWWERGALPSRGPPNKSVSGQSTERP